MSASISRSHCSSLGDVFFFSLGCPHESLGDRQDFPDEVHHLPPSSQPNRPGPDGTESHPSIRSLRVPAVGGPRHLRRPPFRHAPRGHVPSRAQRDGTLPRGSDMRSAVGRGCRWHGGSGSRLPPGFPAAIGLLPGRGSHNLKSLPQASPAFNERTPRRPWAGGLPDDRSKSTAAAGARPGDDALVRERELQLPAVERGQGIAVDVEVDPPEGPRVPRERRRGGDRLEPSGGSSDELRGPLEIPNVGRP